MHRPGTLDRRSALWGAVLVLGAAGAGCSGGGRRLGASATTAHPASAKGTARPSVDQSVDLTLRSRAVTEQQRLLSGSAAPAGLEPFASVRTMHLEHLKRLIGSPAHQPAAAAHPPAAADLAAAERTAAVQLRADCLRASPELAPLLASLAASSEVAAVLLAP